MKTRRARCRRRPRPPRLHHHHNSYPHSSSAMTCRAVPCSLCKRLSVTCSCWQSCTLSGPFDGRIEPYPRPGPSTPPISSLSWLVWELGRLYSGDGKELARTPLYIDLALLLYFCTCTMWLGPKFPRKKTSLLHKRSRELQGRTRAAP